MTTLDGPYRRAGVLRGRENYVVLLIALVAAAVATLMINGMVDLVLGYVPTWLWWTVLLVEGVPAVFLAAVLFSSGPRSD